jgi:hypothetical protein
MRPLLLVLSGFSLAFLFSSVQTQESPAEETCLGEPPSFTVVLKEIIVLKPVRISIFVEEDVIISINGGIATNVNNAPTLIDLMFGTKKKLQTLWSP